MLLVFINSNLFSQQKNSQISPLDQIQLLTNKSISDFSSIPDPQFKADISSCPYPHQGISPGRDVLPKISDAKRVQSILDLISKISKCEKLPFREDGQIFQNKEKKLPEMPLGYYREYTLIVPKDSMQQFYIGNTQYTAYPSYGVRGPERLIIGGGEIIYYTPTHYDNFEKINIVKSSK